MTREDVLRDPEGIGSQKTTRKFITSEIQDMVSLIEMIERKYNTTLLGERKHLDRPYEDCEHMTNIQVVHFFLSGAVD